MINIITGISIGGITVGAMALIVILSAFNGLETLVASLYSSFDPDIKITAKEGKSFLISEFPEDKVKQLDVVDLTSRSMEETVVLKYRGKQTFATLKGVDPSFRQLSKLDSMVFDGEFLLESGSVQYLVAGYGIADKIGLYSDEQVEPVYVYAAKRTQNVNPNLADAFRVEPISPSGIFAINPDFDSKYALVPFAFATKLLDREGRASSYEIKLTEGVDPETAKTAIEKVVGPQFEVKTRYQLNEIIYKTNKTEKWVTFLILSFVLVVATFNLIGCLTMLIIDKREDIFILKSMGATREMVNRIFFSEGLLIAFVGGLAGLTLGLVLTLLQQHVGIVALQGVIVEYYPMEIEILDFIAVFSIVMVIGAGAAWVPAKVVTNRYYQALIREA